MSHWFISRFGLRSPYFPFIKSYQNLKSDGYNNFPSQGMTKLESSNFLTAQYVPKQLSPKDLITDLFRPFIPFGTCTCHLFRTSSSVMSCVVLILSFFFRHSTFMLREYGHVRTLCEPDEGHLQHRWKMHGRVFMWQWWLKVDQDSLVERDNYTGRWVSLILLKASEISRLRSSFTILTIT